MTLGFACGCSGYAEGLGQALQGAPGPSSRFGRVVFTERTIEPSDVFAANDPKPIQFTPETVRSSLLAPFDEHVFWDGEKIVGREFNDALVIGVNLILIPTIAGGHAILDVDVGSSLGPIATVTAAYPRGAGVSQRVTFPSFEADTAENFMANGAILRLTSTVPMTVTSESIRIRPVDVGPPSP